MKIIDLSQEIFVGMPVFDGHPNVAIDVVETHEQRAGIKHPTTISPTVHKLTFGEHTGTHVDAFNHFGSDLRERGIDTMPLEMFITSGFCLDFSHKGLLEPIDTDEIETAIAAAKLQIRPNDTVLLYTDHYRKHYDSSDWPNGPGITEAAAIWFGEQRVAAIGVETRSPGVRKVSNSAVHRICGQMGFTHYENLINLHQLVGIGRFQFIGLPLKIRGGTGSPVRAVAVIS